MTDEQAFAIAVQLHQAGRIAEAESLYRQILIAQPGHFGALANIGQVHRAAGRLDEAIAAYQQALQLAPPQSGILNSLGLALAARGNLSEAIEAFRQSIQIEPTSPEVHRNLAKALIDQGKFAEAITACGIALRLKPDYPQACYSLGTALAGEGRLDEAVDAYRNALRLLPNYPEVHNNLGTVLQEIGLLDVALEAYRRALQLRPDYSEARLNCSLLLLLRGDFEEGLPLNESRWEAFAHARRDFEQPRWSGTPLNGERILIYAEQGFGDSLQFVRYVPLVAQRGGRVIVECQPELKHLFASIDGVEQLIGQGESLPDFDFQCPMMSLPMAFGTRLETIPAKIPYLRADSARVAWWRQRLDLNTGAEDQRNSARHRPVRVGLIWAGGIRPLEPGAILIDRRRSMHLGQFKPLSSVPGVVFVSLQKGPPVLQAQMPSEAMPLLDWTNELHDFAETAALIDALDLVISVDTAGAHLAGALGKPVWLLNRFDSCWRWLQDRTDSRWYPTMRLFRQPRPGDWTSVVQCVAQELQRVAANGFTDPIQ